MVVACIEQMRSSGVRLRDMVVLSRAHSLAAPVQRALRAAGLRSAMLGEGCSDRVVEQAAAQDLLCYARLLCDERDDAAFERVVNRPPRGIGPAALAALREACGGGGASIAAAVLAGELGGVAAGPRQKLLVRSFAAQRRASVHSLLLARCPCHRDSRSCSSCL